MKDIVERCDILKTFINLKSFPISPVLPMLLQDKTTKLNIIWATKSYLPYGAAYADDKQITDQTLVGLDPIVLQPRIMKTMEQQRERSKSHAEVFTPSWVCNKMNNHCDEVWFGRAGVFNTEKEQSWTATTEAVTFPKGKTWMQYVDSRRLEITCGEAPFLVSRYDASSGKTLPIPERIGILDRKLRVVNENTANEDEWMKWAIRSFQSVYGYEFQGDNLLIGRINLLMTFVEYLEDRWNRLPTEKELQKIANIIAWNLWQMDGLSGTVPLGVPEEDEEQIDWFDLMGVAEENKSENVTPKCRIYDWRKDNSIIYIDMKEAT